ncbi:MAG: flagellar basal body-associated FliL family protein, partial [Terriglobales bacterium]
ARRSRAGARAHQERACRLAFALVLAATMAASGCKYFGHTAAAAPPLPPTRIIKLDSTVLNLNDTANSAYLRIGVSLAMRALPATDNDAATESIARDTIVALASAHSSEELLTGDGKAQLKKALLAEMQRRLPDAHIEDIYIDEFLVQH